MSSRMFVRYAGLGNLYEFLCLCFGLGSAPRIFSKLLKVPIALLRQLNIRSVIYLNDIFLMGRTLDEILMSRGTTVLLLKHLGFVKSLEKKSFLKPPHQIDILSLKEDTHTMTSTLTQEKMKKIILNS